MNLKHNAVRFFLGISRHYSRYGWMWMLALLIVVVLTHHWKLAYNYTNSLPQTLFAIHLGQKNIERGDYVAFYPPKTATAGNEMPFVKKVVCLPGESIRTYGQQIFCEDKPVAVAKKVSLKGEPLQKIQDQVLGEEDYFVLGTHPDSFDSRYSNFGPINRCRFIGKAYPIF